MKRARTPKTSVTLIELLVALVIVGVLATLGVSQYMAQRDQVLDREARANLKLVAAAEKIYRLEFGSYAGTSDTDNTNVLLKLLLPSTSKSDVIYKVTNSGASTFLAQARIHPSSGSRCWTIAQNAEEPSADAACAAW